jgi:hypothetical protein
MKCTNMGEPCAEAESGHSNKQPQAQLAVAARPLTSELRCKACAGWLRSDDKSIVRTPFAPCHFNGLMLVRLPSVQLTHQFQQRFEPRVSPARTKVVVRRVAFIRKKLFNKSQSEGTTKIQFALKLYENEEASIFNASRRFVIEPLPCEQSICAKHRVDYSSTSLRSRRTASFAGALTIQRGKVCSRQWN